MVLQLLGDTQDCTCGGVFLSDMMDNIARLVFVTLNLGGFPRVCKHLFI